MRSRNCLLIVKDDALIITWELDGHKSTFTGTWLRENIYDIKSGEINTSRTSPAAISYWKDIPTLCWESYMGSDSGVYELLHNVVQHGVCIIKNTPLRVDEVKNVAERIAPISHGYFLDCSSSSYALSNSLWSAFSTETFLMLLWKSDL